MLLCWGRRAVRQEGTLIGYFLPPRACSVYVSEVGQGAEKSRPSFKDTTKRVPSFQGLYRGICICTIDNYGVLYLFLLGVGTMVDFYSVVFVCQISI